MYIFLFLLFIFGKSFSQVGPSEQTITIDSIVNTNLSNEIRLIFNKLQCVPENVVENCQIPSFSENDFNFDKVYRSRKPNESEIGYSVKSTLSTPGIQFVFSVSVKDGIYKNPMLVKTKDDKSQGVYNELNENKSLTVNNNNGEFEYIASAVDFGVPQNYIASSNGCGQCVIDCINDAYSKHGWASVWAWVQSAFLPQTLVGIALGCTTKCCLRAVPSN